MAAYQYITDPVTNVNSTTVIKRTSDGAIIPINASFNRDCISYQNWLLGKTTVGFTTTVGSPNTPDPA